MAEPRSRPARWRRRCRAAREPRLPGIPRSRQSRWGAAGTPNRASSTGSAPAGRTSWSPAGAARAGGRPGSTARSGHPSRARRPASTPGVRVPELDGLRCLCPIPNDRPSRFDLVALGRRRAGPPAQRGHLEANRSSAAGCPGAGRGPGDRARASRPDDGRRLGPGRADRPARGCPRPDRLLAGLGPAPARSAGWPQPEGGPSLLRPRGTVARPRPGRSHLLAPQRRASGRAPVRAPARDHRGIRAAGHRPSPGSPGGFAGGAAAASSC